MDKTIFRKNNFSMTSKFFFYKERFAQKKASPKGREGKRDFSPGFENVGIPFKDLRFSFYLPIRIFLILFWGCFLLIPQSLLFNSADEEEKGIFATSTKVFILLLLRSFGIGSFHGGRSRALCEKGWILVASRVVFMQFDNESEISSCCRQGDKDSAIFDGQGFGGRALLAHVESKNYCGFWNKLLAFKFPSSNFFFISVPKAISLKRKK